MIEGLIFSLIAIYLLWFVSYLFVTELGRHYFRAVNKVFLALIYLALGIIAFFMSNADKSLIIYLLIALAFTCIGDIVLMFHFTIGAAFFTLGNIFVFIFEIMLIKAFNIAFNQIWYFILVFIVVFSIGAIYFKKSKSLDMKNKYYMTLAYLFFVTMHGAMSSVLFFVLKEAYIMPLCVGSMLFMASDYILAKYEFSKIPEMRVQRLNTACYFMGILLISLSIFMM